MKKNNILNFKKKQLCLIAVFCILFFAPAVLFAQIEITEIMYDLEIGSDSGREWIEIFNSGTEDIDTSELKLYEAETNHKIKSVIEDGNTILAGGDYAILVDNYEKFKEDWPNFSGLVLDTAFSLKNSGEILTLRNSELVDIDSVNYLSDWGANGDGKSLQKVNGEWVASLPTLGKVNIFENGSSGEEENSENEVPPPVSQGSSFDFIEINIKAKIDSFEYSPIAGADVVFKGKALGLENEILENANYQWTFGDGTKEKGQSVLHNFAYPGEYLVVMEVISGEYAICDKLKIKVIPSDIIISSLGIGLSDNFIELYNPSNYEINLSWWRLRADNTFFTFPKNTIFLPKSHLKLPFSVTGLVMKENSVIQLLYPNGMIAFDYINKKEPVVVAYIENPKVPVAQKKEPISQKPLLYSVEKPSENNLNNQTATIINNSIPKNKSGEVEPLQIKNDGDGGSGFGFPINKWTLMLAGIVLVAVIGVSYATKLDLENEKPF